MKTLILYLTLGLAALVGPLQARDWGFSRDTVKEWDGVTYDGTYPPHPLLDTLRILNTGADTIWLDTAWLEVIQPKNPSAYFKVIAFDFGESVGGTTELEFVPGALWQNQGTASPFPHAWADRGKKKTLQGIRITGALKSQQITPDTASMILLAIYRARGRGQDTLVAIGSYLSPCCITSIHTGKTTATFKVGAGAVPEVNALGRQEFRPNTEDPRMKKLKSLHYMQKNGGN